MPTALARRPTRPVDASRARRVGAGVAVLGVAVAAAVRIGRTAGTLPTEAAATLPGDGLTPEATSVTTRAVEIAAPPEAVWPWLVQMGYGRGGWYAIDALERLLGVGDFATGGSADRVVPELQDLEVGDRVPMSDQVHLVVAHLDAPNALVLVLPRGPLSWVWSYNLRPVYARGSGGSGGSGGIEVVGTRLLVRTRMGAVRGWVAPVLPPLEAGHLVMELVQLHRLRRRIEAAEG